MVSNEVFVGAGTSATLVPEMDMFYNDGTVDASNNTISFGAETVFESAAVYYTSIDFDSTNNKVLIAYRDGGNSYYGTAIVGTVSGTDISFGTATVFESASTQYITTRFDPDTSKFLIVYRDNGNSQY